MKQRADMLDPEVREFMKSVKFNRWKRMAIRSCMNASLRIRISRMKDEGMNIIISMVSETGGGKSTVAWVLAELVLEVYGEEMGAARIFFEDAGLLDAVERSREGDIYIKDEQAETFGEGSHQVSAQLKNIEMTVRKGEVSLIYCAPELKIHCHHYIIEPVLKLWNCDLFSQWRNRYQVLSWVYKTSDAYNSIVRKPIGYLLTGLPKGTRINPKARSHKKRIVFPLEYRKYERMKDEYIARVKRGDVASGSQFFLDAAAERFLREEDLMVYRKNKDILTTLKRIDIPKPYNRNFTGGQLDTIKELIKAKARDRNIDHGWKD